MKKLVFGIVIVISIGFSPTLIANDQAPRPNESPVPAFLLARITASQTLETYMADLFRPFRQAAGADQVLDRSELQIEMNRDVAKLRAYRIRELLTYDLNADAAVNREEIEQGLDGRQKSNLYIQNRIDSILDMDANRDGNVTFEEAYYYFTKDILNFGRDNMRTSVLEVLMLLDPNGDERLTANEVEVIGRATFAQFDANGNGILSESERQTSAEALRQTMPPPRSD